MIKAKGIKNGKETTVIFQSGDFMFNGEADYSLEAEIRLKMEDRPAYGGTYYPEVGSNANILAVLQNGFFDRPTLDLESDEPVELPDEGKEVY